MKQCSTLLVIKEIRIVTKGDTNTYLVDWLKLKRLIIPSVVKDVEELELSYSAGGNIK